MSLFGVVSSMSLFGVVSSMSLCVLFNLCHLLYLRRCLRCWVSFVSLDVILGFVLQTNEITANDISDTKNDIERKPPTTKQLRHINYT